RKRLCDQGLAQSVAVSIGRVEERDAQIERLVHQRDRLALGELSPPPGRDRPKTEPNFAHAQVGVFVSAIAHQAATLIREEENVQRRTSNADAPVVIPSEVEGLRRTSSDAPRDPSTPLRMTRLIPYWTFGVGRPTFSS